MNPVHRYLAHASVMDRAAMLEARYSAPWQLSSTDYVGGRSARSEVIIDEGLAWSDDRVATLLDQIRDFVPAHCHGMLTNPDLQLFEAVDRDRHCDLPHIVVMDGDDPVGAYVGGEFVVAVTHRLRGIGSELALARAILHDNGRQVSRSFTTGALAAVKASHRLGVLEALRLGKAVPERAMQYGSPEPDASLVVGPGQ